MLKSLLVSALLVAATTAWAADEFVEGRNYQLVTPAQPTTTKGTGKVEVVELFWYGCPHCYAFEPTLSKWLKTKADYIEFIRIPAVFAANWEIHARAYYAAEKLGVLDKIHQPLFDALHEQKRSLFTVDELTEFFAEHGVPAADFKSAYESFEVDTKARRALALTRAYGISGVPSVIINGKYRSGAQFTGNFENLLKLVDFLADKEHVQ